VTRMRLSGEIPWDWICDETRPVSLWRQWKNAADFIGEQTKRFLTDYSRDLLQSQSLHFEVVVEKLTVQNFIDPVASKYGMPVVILRGNSGIVARYQIAERYRASGKAGLFLLCLGDCDPDGDSIVETTLASLRDDLGIASAEGTRVAMTHEQADRLRLPKMLDADDKQSSNKEKFVTKHGRTDCYELEAVDPDVLQAWLDTAIRKVLDIEAYNHELDRQRDEAKEIMAHRRAVCEVIKRGQ
jgi:hypothetical protein